jgi:hypothetical protein
VIPPGIHIPWIVDRRVVIWVVEERIIERVVSVEVGIVVVAPVGPPEEDGNAERRPIIRATAGELIAPRIIVEPAAVDRHIITGVRDPIDHIIA